MLNRSIIVFVSSKRSDTDSGEEDKWPYDETEAEQIKLIVSSDVKDVAFVFGHPFIRKQAIIDNSKICLLFKIMWVDQYDKRTDKVLKLSTVWIFKQKNFCTKVDKVSLDSIGSKLTFIYLFFHFPDTNSSILHGVIANSGISIQ